MRILWLSNAPFATVGYGTIVRNLIPEINRYHPSALKTNFGFDGHYKFNFNGITIYGKGYGNLDERTIPYDYRDWNADILITIYDVWALNELHNFIATNNICYCPYIPVDTKPIIRRLVDVLRPAFKIIPMSKYGEAQLKKHYSNVLPTIYPGVNPEIYKPLWETDEQKNKLKLKLGFSEDVFLIGMLGDIKYFRKSWAENLLGVKIFMDNNPDIKVGVYVHTLSRPLQPIDFNVPLLIQNIGLEKVSRFVDQYAYIKGIPDIEMAEIYNAIDVYCVASRGEGAGMQYLESAACGTPSIATNFTSMPEVVKDGKTGYLVKVLFEQYEQSISRKAIPDPDDIANKLEKIYNRGSTSFRNTCVEFAKKFHWSKIINERWLPTLEQLEADIDKACFKIPQAVAEQLKVKIIE